MELTEYIRLARKWWWLAVIAALLAGGVGFLMRSQQQDVYRAEVMLSIGGYIESPNPNTSEIYTGERLAQTYAVLAKTYDILSTTVDRGDFPITPELLGNITSTRIVADTSLLVLSVTYTDPILAADMANELAVQLVANSPSNLTPEQQAQIDLATAEIEVLTSQLADLRTETQLIDSQLEDAVFPEQIESLRVRRSVLVDQINQATSNLAQFSNTVASLQQRSNSISIVEPARIPTYAQGSSALNSAILAAMVGVALAGGAVLLIEYLDDTIKTPEQVTQQLGMPVVGAVTKYGTEDYADALITLTDPSSNVSEQFRSLRTNLLFSSEKEDGKARSFIVTSPGPSDGKSVTAANMAVVMAAAGMNVLLIDADLRRPKQHRIFDLDNKNGLTSMLVADPADDATAARLLEKDYADCLKSTAIPRLRIITSGFLPSNPSEVLGTSLMQRWFKVFTNSSNVDVVIFDTPPIMVVSDAGVLAAATDSDVVLVVNASNTRRNAGLKAREKFTQLNVDVKGVVLNRVKQSDLSRDYGYNGYYYYYSSEPEQD